MGISYKPRKCPECAVVFPPRRVDQGYCSAACNAAANKRELARARVLYRALYHWRYNRASAKENIRFICREIRAWIDADKAAGRGPPPPMRYGEKDMGLQCKPIPAGMDMAVRWNGEVQCPSRSRVRWPQR